MTSLEFSNEFDILYNSISSNSSPGFDLYEKSLYLTKAQEEIVKNYYDPASNRKQKGFENSEKRRHDLRALVKDFKSSVTINSSENIIENSYFYEVPSNIFAVINEKMKILSGNNCLNGKNIEVIPKTHDEYNVQIRNPFKKPSEDTIWRLDFSNIDGKNVVELVMTYSPKDVEYQMRYLKIPSPIILTDLNEEFPSESLTINDISQETLCELHPFTQKEILDRAVELALRDYKAQNLEAKVQLNTRNE